MVNDFKKFMRDKALTRLDISESMYAESVALSLKLFNQSIESGMDVKGNPFTEKELAVMSVMTEKLESELQFIQEDEMNSQA